MLVQTVPYGLFSAQVPSLVLSVAAPSFILILPHSSSTILSARCLNPGLSSSPLALTKSPVQYPAADVPSGRGERGTAKFGF